MKNEKDPIEEAAKNEILKQETSTENTHIESSPKNLGNIKETRPEMFEMTDEPKKLGNIKETRPEMFNIGEEQKNELGWKNMPLECLPTQGLFYPAGTKLAIRAAQVQEIRHWSTIDEMDNLGIDDVMNYVMERCVQIVIPGKRAYHKDLKEIDRFYLLFAIREYTFKEGENRLYTDIPLKNGGNHRVEVTKEIISYFKPADKLMKFYSEAERCFIFNLKSGERLKIYIPNIGITTFLKDYRREKQQQRQTVDQDFEKYCLFLFEDWRGLTKEKFEEEHMKSFNWTLEKISVLSQVVDLVKDSVNPTISTVIEGEGEVTVPLNFQGGLKAIFVIPDILDELI